MLCGFDREFSPPQINNNKIALLITNASASVMNLNGKVADEKTLTG